MVVLLELFLLVILLGPFLDAALRFIFLAAAFLAFSAAFLFRVRAAFLAATLRLAFDVALYNYFM